MLCLHGKPTGSRVLKSPYGRRTPCCYDYCQQPSTCHFEVYSNDMHKDLYCEVVKTFLATDQELPKCCAVNKPPANDEHRVETRKVNVERNNAKMKVVTDTEKESFGRPFFVCPLERKPCNYFAWGDQKIVEAPLCKHQWSSRMLKVKKEGPNKDRSFFCCRERGENRCKFFKWVNDEEKEEDLPVKKRKTL